MNEHKILFYDAVSRLVDDGFTVGVYASDGTLHGKIEDVSEGKHGGLVGISVNLDTPEILILVDRYGSWYFKSIDSFIEKFLHLYQTKWLPLQ